MDIAIFAAKDWFLEQGAVRSADGIMITLCPKLGVVLVLFRIYFRFVNRVMDSDGIELVNVLKEYFVTAYMYITRSGGKAKLAKKCAHST